MSLINSIIVKTKVAPLYSLSTFKSEMVTQALMWEELKVLNKHDNWFKVKQWDGYISWIHNSYTISNCNILSEIKDQYKDEEFFLGWYCNYKSKSGHSTIESECYLPLGACVPLFQNNDQFHFRKPDGSSELINIKNYIKKDELIYDYPLDILHFSSCELNVPYLWGGKTSFGYDCSGFVQTILKLYGIKFPRDCSDQFKSPLLKKIALENSKVGDLIFFNDNGKVSHVGIFINNYDFIHSSGEVKIDSINPLSVHDFSSELKSKFIGLYRFKNES